MGERKLESLQLLDCKMNVLASCSFGHLVHIVPVCYFILKPTFTCELKKTEGRVVTKIENIWAACAQYVKS